MCGSIGVDRRINQRAWEKEDSEPKIHILKHSVSHRLQGATYISHAKWRAPWWFFPDGFPCYFLCQWMIKSCVDVCWMVGCLAVNVEYWRFIWMFVYFVLLTVANECMLQYTNQ